MSGVGLSTHVGLTFLKSGKSAKIGALNTYVSLTIFVEKFRELKIGLLHCHQTSLVINRQT